MWLDWFCVKIFVLGDVCGYLLYMERKFLFLWGEVGGLCYLINIFYIRNFKDFDVIVDFVFKVNVL